jgi:hypothetical protein
LTASVRQRLRQSMTDEFEIIDRYNARWRYKYSAGYSWAWGIKAGTLDAQDHEMVEVWLSDDDGESKCVAYFPKAAMVGDCTENTCLNFNLRETYGKRA